MKFTPGTKVKIINVNKDDLGIYEIYAIFNGIGTVSANQDCPNMVKVDFDDKWQGYFHPSQIEVIEKNHNKHLIEIMRKAITMDENEKKNIYKRLDNLEKEIKQLKNYLINK